jgi:hypothetical protein
MYFPLNRPSISQIRAKFIIDKLNNFPQNIDSINIFVTGKTHSGKTTLGNRLLGIDYFLSTGRQDCTKEINLIEFPIGLKYFDLPGVCSDDRLENYNGVALELAQVEDFPCIDELTLAKYKESQSPFEQNLSVSDYTDKLENIKTKVLKVIETFKSQNINHYVRTEIEWYDFGDLRIKKNLPTDELIKHFDSCTAPFRGLNDGKFYYCHLNTSAVRTKLFPLNENDYLDIHTISKEQLLKFDLGYTDLGYITFCDNCNGCNTGIKVPVSYEKQGVRDL